MLLFSLKNTNPTLVLRSCLLLCIVFSSCNITRKAPKGKPYLSKNSYDIVGGKFNKLEESALVDRLENQLDDSSKLVTSSMFFVINILKRPPAYDTGFSALSAANMRASMYHLGYYNSTVSYRADTTGKKVAVKYTVNVGNPTLIDTFSYRLAKPDLQALSLKYASQSIVQENNPITKAAVLGEIARQVDTFRNNGYYKFTAAELRMRGDTTIEALTNVSDDPFEQLRLLAEAQAKRDSPSIKLALVINQPEDSTKLDKYFINKVYVLQDFAPGDDLNDTTSITQRATRNFVLRYHKQLFRPSFLARNISLRPGQAYSQSELNKTLSSLAKASVWQTTNIQVRELPDTSKLDIIVELIPAKKYGFEAAIEASYSATSSINNALGGSLFGVSFETSLLDRNIGREGIRMTHRLRAGIELNNNSRGTNTGLINSTELGYANTVTIPRNINFTPTFLQRGAQRRNKPGESFINTSIALNNRLNLFNLQTFNLSFGKRIPGRKSSVIKTTDWIFRPLNAQFSYLYNQSDSFKTILAKNPFLNYSYNTSFVIGMGAGFINSYRNPRHLKSLSKERTISINGEESGLTWGALPVLNKFKRRFVKLDVEYKYAVNYSKTGLVVRGFVGVGVPIFKDSSLPFFKQYFGGGTSSMRGWPIRGIGRGSQSLPAYKQVLFNDRTGDIQLEANIEYRYNIATIIPNLLTLRGAVFADIGNIWNFKNSRPGGITDSAQFKFRNLYKEIGVAAGTGFRLDFNYVVLRFDFGFRFKRPELSYVNSGWKAPPIGFDDFLKKIFTKGRDEEYRKWRYENFNFTVGIGVPF